MRVSVLVPDKIVLIEGQEPLVIEDIKYPTGVVSLYYDSNKGEGYMQFSDSSLELKPVIEADLAPYVKAYEKEAKRLARQKKTPPAEKPKLHPLPEPIHYLDPPEDTADNLSAEKKDNADA